MPQHPSSDNFRQNATARRLVWWLLGILGAILVAGGARSVTIIADHAERISHLESETSTIEKRLERIEGKLDRLLERRQ